MKVTSIITTRHFNTWPSWHLVYEWEDILYKQCNIKLEYEKKIIPYLNKFIRRLPLNPFGIIFNKSGLRLEFHMIAKTRQEATNRRNIIPVIIDFYLSENQLSHFYRAYSRNRLILISSAEAFAFLKSHNCPLNIVHFPLSVPDKYKIDPNKKFNKKWDLVLAGRQNPVLEKWLNSYVSDHPNLRYVTRELVDGEFKYYSNNGTYLGEFGKRESYIELIGESKIGLYATPGIDGGEARTNGFNQVTPRFLELLVSGCHVISRYNQNEDTQFFNLNDLSYNVDSYDMFKKEMDRLLYKEIPYEKYIQYLEKHYTSNRCKELLDIIEKHFH